MKRKILLIFLVTLLCFFVVACDNTQTESRFESGDVSIESNNNSANNSNESTSDESSNDESSEDLALWFDEFTNGYFSSSELKKEHGALAKDIMFGGQFGYAIQYPSFENEKSDAEIANVIDELKSEFDAFTSALETPTVLCVDYSSALNGSYGNVIFNVEYVSKNDEVLNRFILTRCFDNSGEVIKAETLFRDTYREIVRDEILLVFAENEEVKAQFSEHDIEAITNDSDSLGEFVLYDDSVDFLFLNDDGTIVAMTLPKIDIRTAFIDVTSIPRKLDPTKKMIAITYDDGPDSSTTNRILDVMEKYGAVATFFELGELIKGHESVLQREVALGCEVGSHSWEHLNMLNHSLEHLQKDKEMVDEAFKNALGYTPKLFRPPYGNTNDAICEMYNMVVIGWTLDTLDWQKVSDGGRKDADALYDYFVAKHEAGKLDGQVALMHSIYSTTAEATERIVPYLLDNGYQLVTVSELITYKLGKEVTPGVRYYSGYTIRDNKQCSDFVSE